MFMNELFRPLQELSRTDPIMEAIIRPIYVSLLRYFLNTMGFGHVKVEYDGVDYTVITLTKHMVNASPIRAVHASQAYELRARELAAWMTKTWAECKQLRNDDEVWNKLNEMVRDLLRADTDPSV
jgi:hypothetical protein